MGIGNVGGDEMVGHDIGEVIEPEHRNLVQYASLMRDAGGQNVVEGRNAVGRDEKQLLVANAVHVSHLAAGVKLEVGEVGL